MPVYIDLYQSTAKLMSTQLPDSLGKSLAVASKQGSNIVKVNQVDVQNDFSSVLQIFQHK